MFFLKSSEMKYCLISCVFIVFDITERWRQGMLSFQLSPDNRRSQSCLVFSSAGKLLSVFSHLLLRFILQDENSIIRQMLKHPEISNHLLNLARILRQRNYQPLSSPSNFADSKRASDFRPLFEVPIVF
jgi:hypothetical protein